MISDASTVMYTNNSVYFKTLKYPEDSCHPINPVSSPGGLPHLKYPIDTNKYRVLQKLLCKGSVLDSTPDHPISKISLGMFQRSKKLISRKLALIYSNKRSCFASFVHLSCLNHIEFGLILFVQTGYDFAKKKQKKKPSPIMSLTVFDQIYFADISSTYRVLVFEKFSTGYDQISPLSFRNYTSPCFNNVSPRVSSFEGL